MNWLSTEGFFPQSIKIWFSLFVLAKKRSGQMSTIGLVGRLASVSGPPDPSTSCSAQPRRTPPPHRAPRRREPPVVSCFRLDKSVYIGFPLSVLAKGRSVQLSTIQWRAKGTVGLWATRPVGVLFCQVPPRPAAPPCAAPTRTALSMFGFWTWQVGSTG